MAIYSLEDGLHCNTHDDLAYKQVYGTKCLGGETITLSPAAAIGLTPVVGTNVSKMPKKAVLILEPDGTEPNDIAARFKMCGGEPDENNGFPLGKMGQISVCRADNIAAFKIIATNSAALSEHKLRVMYFD